MPFKPAEAYELDASEPWTDTAVYDDDSDVSEIDELDPLKSGKRRYTDDASNPLRSVFDTEKNASSTKASPAWLDPRTSHRLCFRKCIPSQFCCMLLGLIVATFVLLSSAGGIWVYKHGAPEDGQSESWYPSPLGGTDKSWEDSYRKAAALVGKMTLVEKVNITTGIGWSMGMCVGNTGPVERLGFPSLCLQDGPLGLRFVDNATAFPAGITVGATWNKQLMYERGKAHGLEARLKGINVVLGPAMGPLGRLPAGGRNWEGFGSDPVLQGLAAAATIRGLQDSGVIATAKHFVGNEQEHFRKSWEWGTPDAISSNIDDRTLHEIYAWPFAESIKAGVGSVMCSYNLVNNSYACQNSKLMNGILKDELGFQGFVQSDWLAQRGGVASALSGLDMTMPGDGLRRQDGNSLWGKELTKAVLNESVPIERLNDMALRVVAAWYQLKQDDKKAWPDVKDGGGPNFSSWTDDKIGKIHQGSPSSTEEGVVNKFVPVRDTKEGGNHDDLARRVAAEGIVLVKNVDSRLPLPTNGADVKEERESSATANIGVFGEDAYLNPDGNNACPDRSCNKGTLAMGWGSGAVELPYLIAPGDALRKEFDSQTVKLTEWKTNDVHHIEATASTQDLCLVFINSDAGEGFEAWDDVKGDRNDLFAQKSGDELVQRVANSCGGDTVVVLHTVGPTILEQWIDSPQIKAVLIAHLPGQESGNALTDVLFGRSNPSGHLPYTIAKNEDDYGPDTKILRVPNALVPQQVFNEGLYVDYRYFDKHQITPRFEFGFGLSYTTFKLSSLLVQDQKLKGNEPAARTANPPQPPELNTEIPDPGTAVWPSGFRKLKQYIYPYIDGPSDIKPGKPSYPPGYDTPRTPSPAGGLSGGNPDLYTVAVVVQATVTNTGHVPGDAVVQAYISYPENVVDADGEPVDMPVRVLRQFEKIHVDSGRKPVKISLTRKDFSYWDVKRQNWVVPSGVFRLCLGWSSRDLPNCVNVEPILSINLN